MNLHRRRVCASMQLSSIWVIYHHVGQELAMNLQIRYLRDLWNTWVIHSCRTFNKICAWCMQQNSRIWLSLATIFFAGNTAGWSVLPDNEAADWQPQQIIRGAWVGAHVACYRVVCLQPEFNERFDSIPKNTTTPHSTGLHTKIAKDFTTRPEKIPATSGGGWSHPA